ncbi:NtaA/DmoA family FMN-dependent monooxygenase [Paraburkholderia fynbosensis]|uniref:Dimethyl-sulfide monooxygenase n=1 Tax=Paraburkholderia fynbosensis TaxID=1200993 RepID=A0A6J5H4C7_9BURK|nr:NtaA/DmoA family FMN-dependent monooxygenase [Paraburkholderia fynbosensis]CAB3810493.1 Dimethyl-sulfide monooxygenase [Paraburkholderia fynbosensis]
MMHLFSFLTHSPINHANLSWADPRDERLEGMKSFKYWQDLARTLERGKFDGVFFADTMGGFDQYKQRTDEAVKYGVWWPIHDPAPVLAAMGAATSHLGLGFTLSTTAVHPYQAVRTISTLDYLTGGRVAWNIVTGASRGEHRALGHEQMDHDERYDRADEFLEICEAYWSGVDPTAILADRKNLILADPEKVSRVEHNGKYFRTSAVPPTFPSPQGRPVIFQAGSSGRGQSFAMKHADVVFAVQPHAQGAKKLMGDLNAAARAAGRDGCNVLFGVQVILGGTEEEARRNQKELVERIPLEAALSRVSGVMGIDFDTLDLDKPLEQMDTQAARGLMAAALATGSSAQITGREAALLWGASAGNPQIVGTPEQVADKLEAYWRDTGCSGFNITPSITPSGIEDFVDHVVPILQERKVFRREYEGNTLRENLLSKA